MIAPMQDRMIRPRGCFVRPRACSMVERVNTALLMEVLEARKRLIEAAEADVNAAAEVTPARQPFGTLELL